MDWLLLTLSGLTVLRPVQGYWRKLRVKEVPQPEHIDAVLSFLAEQGMLPAFAKQGDSFLRLAARVRNGLYGLFYPNSNICPAQRTVTGAASPRGCSSRVGKQLRHLHGLSDGCGGPGVKEDTMATVLTKFPEVLALDVASQLQKNVDTLQSQWFVRGLALKKLLRTQPQVCRCACAAFDFNLRRNLPVGMAWSSTTPLFEESRCWATAGAWVQCRLWRGLPG